MSNRNVNIHKNQDYHLTNNTNIVSGDLNGLNRRVMKKMVNINSLFRNSEKLGPCVDPCKYDIKSKWSSSNFVIHLPTIYDKVVSMSLTSIELPHTFYTFSSSLKNNVFTIIDRNGASDVPYIIEIMPGNYSNDQLIAQINHSIDQIPALVNKIKLFRDSITNKLFFVAAQISGSHQTYDFDLDFRLPNNETRDISQNFGWLLGYRKAYYYGRETTVTHDTNACGNPIDAKICDYDQDYIDYTHLPTYMMPGEGEPVTDIHRNSIKNHSIHPSDEQKKRPEMAQNYPDSTMIFFGNSVVTDFTDTEHPNSRTTSRTIPTYPVFPQGFVAEASINTKGPRYFFLLVDDFKKNTDDSYQSLVSNNTQIPSSNILARLIIPTNRNTLGFYTPSDFVPKKREYFGPVRIDKLHFRIVDEFGRTVDMNNTDISLLLEFEVLYNL
ncbi:hypothetical protein CL656_04700 [bacterium]|nr:hypothetical protein [bacterium]|tara:strand:- start:3583 stop:4899 length:1317 start_codon:yes stop_codon:yes gene_type:complete